LHQWTARGDNVHDLFFVLIFSSLHTTNNVLSTKPCFVLGAVTLI